jgi:hypothetical protein
MIDKTFALYVMLGQTAERTVDSIPEIVPPDGMLISPTFDVALSLPEEVKKATRAAAVYKLFFVFENFLRSFVLSVLSETDPENWWTKVPTDVREDVEKLEATEDAKAWMALGTRDKLSLTTYNQLIAIMDGCWKSGFEPLVRDKYLLQEARHIAHIRNAACHMTEIPEEEAARVRQVLRDWFRVVAP